METGATVGHVCGVALLDPSPRGGELTLDAVLTVMEQRLPLLPPLRRRLVQVTLGIDRPYWADDPDFDLNFDMRELSLPAPGGKDQLSEQIARIGSRALDRRRPLWVLGRGHVAHLELNAGGLGSGGRSAGDSSTGPANTPNTADCVGGSSTSGAA